MFSAPNTPCLSVDPSLHNFLHSLVSLTLFFFLFFVSLSLSLLASSLSGQELVDSALIPLSDFHTHLQAIDFT